jgi:hypothetical protein
VCDSQAANSCSISSSGDGLLLRGIGLAGVRSGRDGADDFRATQKRQEEISKNPPDIPRNLRVLCRTSGIFMQDACHSDVLSDSIKKFDFDCLSVIG